MSGLSIQPKRRFGVEISKQSINERFSEEAVEFFKIILEKAIGISTGWDYKINFTEFETVRIKDSTSFQLS